MTRTIFSSSELPGGLNERQKFSRFHDIYSEKFSRLDMHAPIDTPFLADCMITAFGGIAVMQYKGTLQGASRTSQHLATGAGDAYHLNLIVGPTPWSFAQRGRELIATEAAPAFTDCSESLELKMMGENATEVVRLPRESLVELIPNLDDHVLKPFDLTSEPLRYLRQYLRFLNGPDGAIVDPLVITHIRTTLLDLVALALGANRDAADLAQARGLRAARLREVFAQIQEGFPNPSFSVHDVATRMGVTPRYIQDILQEAGLGFVERMTELRLQKARHMLSHQQYDYLKIGEVALSCGFNDVSYFTRLFRRRFGDVPREFRRRNS